MNRVDRIFTMIYMLKKDGQILPSNLPKKMKTSQRTFDRDLHDVKRFYKNIFGQKVVRSSIEGITYYEVEK